MAAGETAVKRTLREVLERWDDADRRARQYQALQQQGKREEAEAERRDIEGMLHSLASDLSQLFLTLLRQALKQDPDVLRSYLMGLLAPDIGTIVCRTLVERNGR